MIEASDGEDGLEVIARQGDELSLIVSDQHMQRISGRRFSVKCAGAPAESRWS